MYDFQTSNEIIKDIASKIKSARIKLNLTQEEISSKTWISISTYKIFENSGKGTFENFVKILKVIGKVNELDKIFLEDGFSPKEAFLGKNKKNSKQRVRKTSAKDKNEVITLNSSIKFDNKMKLVKNDVKSTKLGQILEKIEKLKKEIKDEK